MKKIIIIVICIFIIVALVVAGIFFYNEFFKKKYVFENFSDERINRVIIYSDGEAVAELIQEERAEALALIKAISVYRKVELDNELSLELNFLGFKDKKISWNEKYIEYDGIVYLADEKALANLTEYCESIIAEHNDTTAKKPYELSAEDISAVKLSCDGDLIGRLTYDISVEDFAVFSEKVNAVTIYQRYNDAKILYGGIYYVFDVELKNGESISISLSDIGGSNEHLRLNGKTYVGEADGLMEFIGTYATIE